MRKIGYWIRVTGTLVLAVVILFSVGYARAYSRRAQNWLTSGVDLSGTGGGSRMRGMASSSSSSGSFNTVTLGDGALLLVSQEEHAPYDDQLINLINAANAMDFAQAELILADITASGITSGESSAFGYKLIQQTYSFTYIGSELETSDAYVRFIPSGAYANTLPDGGFCLQNLAVIGEGDLTRLFMADCADAYYYNAKLSPGESITLVHTIFTESFATVGEALGFELVQTSGNATVFEWNVMGVGDGLPQVFDYAFATQPVYYPFEIELLVFETTDDLDENPDDVDSEENDADGEDDTTVTDTLDPDNTDDEDDVNAPDNGGGAGNTGDEDDVNAPDNGGGAGNTGDEDDAKAPDAVDPDNTDGKEDANAPDNDGADNSGGDENPGEDNTVTGGGADTQPVGAGENHEAEATEANNANMELTGH